MNKANILRIADAIEKHEIEDLGFHMAAFHITGIYADLSGHGCKTTACIAGWTLSLLKPKWEDLNAHDIEQGARSILGLDQEQAEDLFYLPDYMSRNSVTAKQAARTLRHLAETGEVDWKA